MKRLSLLLAGIVLSAAVAVSAVAANAGNAGNSLPGILALLLSVPPTTTTGPSVSGTTATGTILSVTINKNGTGYYLVRLATEADPVVSDVLAGTSFAMSANVAATSNITGLVALTNYKLYFVAKDAANNKQKTVQNVAFTTISGGGGGGDFTPALNDTGITWGGSYPSGNNPGCTGEEVGAQDCSHGRDVTHNDDADGHAGFSFTKISNSGAVLSSSAILGSGAGDWACNQDNVTGLIWEVKTADGGLRDQNDSYFWYNTNPATNGGADGYADPGNTCEGYVSGQPATYCNTEAFVARVNAVGLCGHSDWRMPTRKELQGIVSFDRVAPAIDTAYFPNTPAYSVVWSGSPYAGDSDGAWGVYFGNGSSYGYYRGYGGQVRLVRGGQ